MSYKTAEWSHSIGGAFVTILGFLVIFYINFLGPDVPGGEDVNDDDTIT
jgi:hypothetical protein